MGKIDYSLLVVALFLVFFGAVFLHSSYAARRRLKTGKNAIEFGDEERARSIHLVPSFILFFHGRALAVFCLTPVLRQYSLPLLWGGFSLLLFSYAFYLGILLPLRCQQCVLATYWGCTPLLRFPGVGFPRFTFKWDGKRYFSTARLNCRRKESLSRQYCVEQQYPVFINPHDPYEVCTSRFGLIPILFALLGVILFLGTLCLFL